MVEFIQGESGVHPLDAEYAKELERICREKDIILIADEVQTGIGRCGTLFAYQKYGVEPDIFTMAKGLGGGVPVGGFAAKQRIADAFVPGDHGTTFGGNALAMRAGCVVIDELLNNGVLENAKQVGAYFFEKLAEIKDRTDAVSELRGAGLMIGIELKNPVAKQVGAAMREKGYLVGTIGETVFRVVPLILKKSDVDEFCRTLESILTEM